MGGAKILYVADYDVEGGWPDQAHTPETCWICINVKKARQSSRCIHLKQKTLTSLEKNKRNASLNYYNTGQNMALLKVWEKHIHFIG